MWSVIDGKVIMWHITVFEAIMTEKVLKLIIDIKLQVQKAQRILRSLNIFFKIYN